MSDIAIGLHRLGKMYKLYRRQADKVADALGINRLLFWRKHYYQEFWALRGLDLEIRQGERLGIIGPNGAGKSTMLKIIVGNVSATEGSVTVRGKVQALMELGTGFHPEFTGRQNIRASLGYQNLSQSDIREKEEEIIDFAELDEFIDHPVKTYSAGMYARLAFSTATAIEPEILIIDEVLGAGDAYFGGKCIERMKNLTNRHDTTVLFVSHDVSSVQKLCTRIIWLHKGKVLMSGKPHEVIREYLAYMRRETEIRLRAEEMHVSKNQARSLFSPEEALTRLLFRFRTDGAHPMNEHKVYDIRLRCGDQLQGHIEVGEPMDNSPMQGNYIIDEAKMTDWSASVSEGDRNIRCYAPCGGRDGHAPFVLSIPAYMMLTTEVAELQISHGGTSGENVYVEFFRNSHYMVLGKLTGGSPDGLCLTSLTVPLGAKSSDAEPSDAAAEAVNLISAGRDHISESDDRTDFGDQSRCKILGLDFILPDNRSTRLIPLGSQVRVDMHYEAAERIQNPVFAITFHRIDGIQMDHKNNKIMGVETGEIWGKGTARFVFNPLRLGVAEYVVSAAILKYLNVEQWDSVPPRYDFHDRRYRISVYAERSDEKNLGAVIQECSFSIEKTGSEA